MNLRKVNFLDKQERLKYIDADIFKMLTKEKFRNVVLAGGALQPMFNNKIVVNDYDLFFIDKNFDKTVANVRKYLEDCGFNCVFECPAGDLFTYKLNDVKVQLITKFKYANVEELLDSFDFRCTQLAVSNLKLFFRRGAIKDTKKKNVVIWNVTYPVATMNRIMKYKYQKDFHVSQDTLREFVYIVNEMELDDEHMVFYVD